MLFGSNKSFQSYVEYVSEQGIKVITLLLIQLFTIAILEKLRRIRKEIEFY